MGQRGSPVCAKFPRSTWRPLCSGTLRASAGYEPAATGASAASVSSPAPCCWRSHGMRTCCRSAEPRRRGHCSMPGSTHVRSRYWPKRPAARTRRGSSGRRRSCFACCRTGRTMPSGNGGCRPARGDRSRWLGARWRTSFTKRRPAHDGRLMPRHTGSKRSRKRPARRLHPCRSTPQSRARRYSGLSCCCVRPRPLRWHCHACQRRR